MKSSLNKTWHKLLESKEKLFNKRFLIKQLIKRLLVQKMPWLLKPARKVLYIRKYWTTRRTYLSLKKIQELISSEKFPFFEGQVDIIIPVYNGFEYLDSFFDSLLTNTLGSYNLIIINDASPDNRISRFLEKRLSNCNNCIIIENESNLGFVATINKGVSLVKTDYFIILNSDIELPNNWLQRLCTPFIINNKIASVTPFSNSAAFFSYPIPGEDNKLPEGFSLNEVDRAFHPLRLDYAFKSDLYTYAGVGFCMAINKECWDSIGGFDYKTFGRGYGEEVDWCLRALNSGWKNVLVPNLFVYHKHGGSFPAEEKRELINEHLKIIYKRWPSCSKLVRNQVKNDPWKIYRNAASLLLSQTRKGAILIIDLFSNDGGACNYRENRIKDLQAEGYNVLLVGHHTIFRILILKIYYSGSREEFNLKDWSDLYDLFGILKVEKIIVNNLLSIEDRITVFKILSQISLANAIPMEYMAHDYLSVCPSFFLVNEHGNYCNVPNNINTCNNCLRENINKTVQCNDIVTWRSEWEYFLNSCTEITFFSESSFNIFKKAYSISSEKLKIREHKPLSVFTEKYIAPQHSAELVIASFGAFHETKGAKELILLANYLQKMDVKAKIFFFGNNYASNLTLPDNLIMSGTYDRNQILELLKKYNVNVVVFLSIWPETFSYVTQECMMLDVPFVCFDIGAPAERIRKYNYEKGRITKDWTSAGLYESIQDLTKDVIFEH